MIKLLFLLVVSQGALTAQPAVHDILDANAIDRKVDPCENFYKFSCNGWESKFQLPADKSRYWRQGNVLGDHVEENLNTLLAGLAEKKKPANANEAKLGAFYRTCMAKEAHEGDDISLLKARLKKLEELGSPSKIAKAMAELDIAGAGGLFGYFGDQDLKDSSRVIAFVDRGGMSLPDPDYYLKDDKKSTEIRARYLEYIAKAFQLVGETTEKAKSNATLILKFETELAKHSLKKDDRRDIEKRFHPMDFAGLKALVPNFDWTTYFKALGTSIPKKINVTEPEFMKTLSAELGRLKPEELSAILQFGMIERAAYFLSGPIQKENFAFWRVYLQGQKELPPQWKYCTQIVSGGMSEALGEAYVKSVPNAAEIHSKGEEMFNAFVAAFGKDLESLTWMDQPTREMAKKKLVKLGHKLGWPKKWRDYSKLKLNDKSFLENEMRTSEFDVRRNLNKIGKPVDRTEWDMAVWEANAYYADSNNEMVLPLGEMVPPVFDPHFSDGANYASLGGSTIGHELTHGFDDSGKDMDANGNFITWWSGASKKKFDEGSECFIKQTEAYEAIPGSPLRIRGKATLGENLADNGGVKLGLMALKEIAKNRKTTAPKFLEFNEIQQYFISYAQGWCSKITDEKLRDQLLTDFHPPADFRVNMVLANQPEFAEAFQCKAGKKMAPKNRCVIW